MNRRARLRLRGLVSLTDPAPASAPIAGGSDASEPRDSSDLAIDLASATDGAGDAIDSATAASSVAGALVAPGERAPSDVPSPVGDAFASTMSAPGFGGELPSGPGVDAAGDVGEPSSGSTVDVRTAAKRGRALRALRALRMARALRLAIALGMAPGTGME
jgi:hypothetical protein